jgi:hypothetical protein
MIQSVTGTRTLVAVLFAIAALTLGLWFIEAGQRAMAYGAFSLAIVGVVGAIATKASVDALSAGDGTKGAWENLTTPKKPGEPPAPEPPPPAGTVETTTKTTVTP